MTVRQRFALSFDDPTHGWLRGQATIGADRHNLLASWMLDTPARLVASAIDSLQGVPSELVWVHEPESTVWTLDPEPDRLRLTISNCETLTPASGWAPASGEDYTMSAQAFASAVLTAMRTLSINIPAESYQTSARWGHPFPTAALATLSDLVPRR